jgi:S-methylmethionine-dependent homocysteine/selenocysteine methylase
MPPRFDRSAWPSPAAEYDAYRELADLFAEASVDLVLIEMLQSAPHVLRACRAVRATGLPFVAGLSCRFSRASDSLVTFDDPSTSIEPALETALESAPDAIAIMHTPVDAMPPALELLRSSWRGPIGAYAEIPYPEDPDGDGSERLSPAAYATAARSWIDSGARIVGGCCGTTPEHIREIHSAAAAFAVERSHSGA